MKKCNFLVEKCKICNLLKLWNNECCLWVEINVMKKIQLFLTIILLTSFAFCQDLDVPLVTKKIDCSDIAHNSSLYYVKYMNENKIDSAQLLLNHWENICGTNEPVFRAKILLALKTRQYNDTLLTNTPLDYIFNYQNRMDMIVSEQRYEYYSYKSYYGYILPDQEFDNFTWKLASDLKATYHTESVEYLLADFYSGNYETIFSKIQSETFENHTLTEKYDEVLRIYKKMPEFHISLLTGLWMPTGELTQLGLHPELGLQIGCKKKKMNYDFTLAFKFVNAPNDYYARRDIRYEDWEATNLFLGYYLGFEIGGDILVKKKHEVQVIGGIAWDAFSVLQEDKENELNPRSTSSFNINFGLAYRHYLTSNFYLGLRVKYNIVDYSLNHVIDFTGNPIIIQFSIGFIKNASKDNYLRALEYRFRK